MCVTHSVVKLIYSLIAEAVNHCTFPHPAQVRRGRQPGKILAGAYRQVMCGQRASRAICAARLAV